MASRWRSDGGALRRGHESLTLAFCLEPSTVWTLALSRIEHESVFSKTDCQDRRERSETLWVFLPSLCNGVDEILGFSTMASLRWRAGCTFRIKNLDVTLEEQFHLLA